MCLILFSYVGYSSECHFSLVLLKGLPMYMNLYAFPEVSCVCHAVGVRARRLLHQFTHPVAAVLSLCGQIYSFFFFATWKSLPVWMSRDLFHYMLATSPVFLHIPFICDFFLLFVACAIVLWQQPTFKLGAAELLQGSATMLLQLTSGRHERRY